jgi:hypothetical protein
MYWHYLCMKQVWSYVTGTICVCNKRGLMLLALSVYETSVVLCYWHHLCMRQVWFYVTGTICV